MDGHARTAGRLYQTFKVGGKKYTLRAPPVGRLIADMEAYIVSIRENPLVLAAKAVRDLPKTIPAEQREALIKQIWDAASKACIRSGAATAAEMDDFGNSLRGIAYKLAVCLEDEHGEEVGTVEAALGLVEELIEEKGEDGLIELQAKLLTVTGEADAKNSSGPSLNGSGKRKDKKRKKNSRDGRRSTSASRPSTDSPREKSITSD